MVTTRRRSALQSLPDDVLGRIFVLAQGPPPAPRDTAPLLVSQAWRRAYLSEPQLWREFELRLPPDVTGDDGDRVQAKLCLLQCVGPFVRSFSVADSGSDDRGRMKGPLGYMAFRRVKAFIPRVLAPLSPALTQLRVTGVMLYAPAVQALRRFPRLQQLELRDDDAGSDMEGLPEALRELRALEHLAVPLDPDRRCLLALASLTSLTSLELDLAWEDSPQLRQQLAPLSTLRHLRLTGGTSLSLPLDLPRLELLSVHASSIMLDEDAAACEFLREDDEESEDEASRSPNLMLRRQESGGWTVALHKADLLCHDGQALAALLRAALPADARLASLQLALCKIGSAAWQGCDALLASTTELVASKCVVPWQPDDDDLEEDGSPALRDALHALLGLTPQLRLLSVSGTGSLGQGCGTLSAGLPPSLVQLQHLGMLLLDNIGVPSLPSGPFLAGLVGLSLSCNNLEEFPAALAGATNLRFLLLHGNPRMKMGPKVVDMLARLPLTALVLQHTCEAGVVARLARRMPDLHIQ